jgi:hypothetical protein
LVFATEQQRKQTTTLRKLSVVRNEGAFIVLRDVVPEEHVVTSAQPAIVYEETLALSLRRRWRYRHPIPKVIGPHGAG